jgi:phenylalanyl-tRNA synthetase beta subunit
MAAQQKKASIVLVGLPWDDERLREVRGVDPAKVKEGIETVDRLLAESGFGRATSIQ